MAPMRRKTDKHLPPRVYFSDGSYYFVDKKKKWHRLGRTLSEAMDKWSQMLSVPEEFNTMNDIFDKYMVEVAPLKAAATFKTNQSEILRLRKHFGVATPSAIQPSHIYKYLYERGKEARIRANREKGLLSHIFTMAVQWGILNTNPCKEVPRLKETPRDRYITDQEFISLKKEATPIVQAIMDFAYLTALRQTDVLKVKLSDIQDEGVHVQTSKTGKKIIIEWSDELRQAINAARSVRRAIRGFYLFCNHKGQPYTPSGFRALWQRIMVRAMKEGKLTERFHFHDIRRKAATDAEKQAGREYARSLLGHTNQNMTANYISGAQKVRPLK